MSKVDQLLAKALSTTSEDEAIACLRMARKQPSAEKSSANPDTNVDWYANAVHYYKLSKDLQYNLNKARSSHEFTYKQMTEFNSMYYSAYNDCVKLRIEIRNLKSWYRTRDTIIVMTLVIAAIAAMFAVAVVL